MVIGRLKMPSSDWCVWCNRVLRGKVSYFHGLCSKCRNTKEGKDYIKAVKLGENIDE